MYSRQASSQIRQSFWTAFGQYMQPVPTAGEQKVNWSNYKTGVRHIAFKLQADRGFASATIELSNPDTIVRQQQFEQLVQLKNLFPGGDAWTWIADAHDENGRAVSRITIELSGVNIFDKADWPAIISFLKQQIVALDACWNEVRFAFE